MCNIGEDEQIDESDRLAIRLGNPSGVVLILEGFAPHRTPSIGFCIHELLKKRMNGFEIALDRTPDAHGDLLGTHRR